MTSYKLIALTLLVVFGLTVLLPSVASASLLGDALKIFGIGYVVSRFGGQIDKFINNLSGQRGIRWEGTTKVVPIFSIGRGSYIGAVQVQGPPDRVSRTKAAAQVETRIGGLGARLFIPISDKRPSGGGSGLNRVAGVGISAVIDFKI